MEGGTPTTKDRVELILASKCDGYLCPQNLPTTLTRRTTANGVTTIHMQCLSCGRSRSGALKRADFPLWQTFRAWDDELVARHRALVDATQDNRRESYVEASAVRAAEIEQAIAQRRADYRRWILTSPEWHKLRDRVWRRAIGQCEACLANRASDVHHLTYRLGKLPPAWELKAVCRECHDRLHDWVGGE